MVRRLAILPELQKTLATGTSLPAVADVTGQTLTPNNYVGFPAAGCDQMTYLRLGKSQVAQSQEIVLVDLHTRPWPVLQRSVNGSPLVAHDATHGILTIVPPDGLKSLVGVYNFGTLVANDVDLDIIGDFLAATYNSGTGRVEITQTTPGINDLDSIDESPRVLKTPVRVATTTAGTLASSFENGDTVDGVTLATNDRILIKDQASGAENGVYVVQASGAPARAGDANSAAEFATGFLVYVKEGTTNAGRVYAHTTTGAITLGVTALTFAQVSGSAPPALVSAAATHSGTQVIPDSVPALVTLDTTKDDSGALHPTTSDTALTGTIAVTNGSTTFTGTGTLFTTELVVGDVIQLTGDYVAFVVTAIASDTSLTVAAAPGFTGSGKSAATFSGALVAPSAGTYLITAALYGDGTDWEFAVKRGRGDVYLIDEYRAAASGITSVAASTRAVLQQHDLIYMQASQSSGGNKNLYQEDESVPLLTLTKWG